MSAGPAAASNLPAAPAPSGGSFNLPAFVWVWIAAAAVMVAMSLLASVYDRFPGDETGADALQDVDLAALDVYFDVVNVFGDTLVYFAITIAVAGGLVVLRAGGEAVLVALMLIPRAFNGFLKEWVERPRPSDDLIDVMVTPGGFSFPSGHTVSSAVLLGAIFLIAPRVVPQRWLRYGIQLVCLLIVAGAGPARVHLGAHWPSDVLGGYLLAFLALAPAYYAYRLLRPANPRFESRVKIGTNATDTRKEI